LRLIFLCSLYHQVLKEADGGFTGEDVLEGLTAVISVKLPEIQFEGQTKAKLGSTEAQGAVQKVFGEAFENFLEEHPDDAKSIIGKAVLALRARKAAKAAKDSILRKGALEGMTLPGKLADCQSKDASESEIFIVEGDSAGGTAKMGRDRKTQAVLPLRGKILNVERARLDRMLGSEQIKNLVIAMGTSIGDTMDITKIRYHKIILATDADVDGAHIRTLILTLMYRYFELEYRLRQSGKKELLHQVSRIFKMAQFVYVRQPTPRGLGDAIMQAEKLVADNPFAIFLGDDIIGITSRTCGCAWIGTSASLERTHDQLLCLGESGVAGHRHRAHLCRWLWTRREQG
jgi:hypothetical protein